MSSLARVVLAAFLIASFGMTSAQPARADQAAFSRNIAIGAALAAVGIIIGSNVAHKAQLASTVVGYTQDGATVYADGRVAYANGYSFYPGDHGQQIACRNMSCTLYSGNSPAAYDGYYQWNGATWGPPASQPQPQQYYPAPQAPPLPQPQYYPPPQSQPQYYPPPQSQPQYYPQPQGYYQQRAYGYPSYGSSTAYAYAQAYEAYYRAYETYYRTYYDYYNRARPGYEKYQRYGAPQPYCCDPASNPYAGYVPGYPRPGY
jgi:hypothetical protein